MSAAVKESSVPLSHPDKVLYPGEGLTKQDLFDYFRKIARLMLPEISNRPLVLVRCPQGRGSKCFFQKHPDRSIPDLSRVRLREAGKGVEYVFVRTVKDILRLAQLNVLEVHCWGSRVENLEQPDRIILDLDPGEGVDHKRVIEAARMLHMLLDSMKLRSFAKATGGKGLHVVIPVKPVYSWDQVKDVARCIAQGVTREFPHAFTASPLKRQRRDKIYIDYLRNSRGATSIAAYSPRARDGAPVAMPLTWSELKASLRFDGFTVPLIMKRSWSRRDAWQGINSIRQVLPQKLIG